MIISYDIENYKKNEKTGEYEPYLDATGKYFTLGVVYKETGGHKVFTDRKEMWKYIIELGLKEQKRGKRLIAYAHNSRYDFYQIADLTDRNLKWFSEDPFICGYYQNENGQNKEIIKFLDTMSLFHMSLKKVGEIIGFPKTEIPLIIGTKLTKSKLKEIAKYCANDCLVILKAIKFLKEKLKKDNINIKNLCTINQIAISYIINKLKEDNNNEHILYRGKDGSLSEYTHKTKYANEIHSAYRGGYVRVWKTGFLNNIYTIDYNSLYPHSATMIEFPDLRTERKINKPLEIISKEELFNKIGISRCLIRNRNNKLGLLQVRGMDKAYVPLNEKYIIGTWTHMELAEAIKEGYEIKDIEWSIIWDKGKNPFKKLFEDIYQKRIECNNEFDKYFYKQILNGSIGKFGQTRMNQEMVIDSIEKVYEYLQRNYEMIKGIEGKNDVMYLNKNINNGEVKKYYAPIIPCLITAQARIIMYRCYKKIGVENLVYTDTDSCIMQGNMINKFNIGKQMGEFKIEKDIETEEDLINTKAIIWGTKAKSVGNNIALSGVFKNDLDMENFKLGKIKYKRMLGLRNSRKEEIGKFIIEERDLKKQLKDFKKSEEIMEKEILYIDKDIGDISFFSKKLEEIEVTPISSNNTKI